MSIITSSSFVSESNSYSIWVTAPKAVGVRAIRQGLAPAGGFDRRRKSRGVKASGTLPLRWRLEDKIRPSWSKVLSPLYGAYTNRPEMESLDYYGRGQGRIAMKLSSTLLQWCTCTIGDSYSMGVKRREKVEALPLLQVSSTLKRNGEPWFYSDREGYTDSNEREYSVQLAHLHERLLQNERDRSECARLFDIESDRLWQEIVEKPKKIKWWDGYHSYIEVQVWHPISPHHIEDWVLFE